MQRDAERAIGERTTTSTTQATERLSPAHQGWLKEFSVVMHRRYAYPPRHPSRLSAESVALAALDLALTQRPEITLAITKRQIVIDGGYSDLKNPALSELAERLHRQGIGTITIRAGITHREFDRLLERIVHTKPQGEDADHDDEPWRDEDDEPSLGPHVGIEMLSYDGLALNDEIDDDGHGTDATGDRLWRELAQLALSGWDGTDGSGHAGGGDSKEAGTGRRASAEFASLSPTGEFMTATSADQLAKVISQRAADSRFAPEVLKAMLRLGRHTRRRGRSGSGALAARLRDVMQRLEPGTMRSLLETELDPAKQRVLFLQGVDALPFSVVLEWIEAAAASADQSISHHLLRLLKKLASQARRRRDNGPDEGGEAMRVAARQLIDGWTLDGRETQAHSNLLERLASYDRSDTRDDGDDLAGADRLVQMALEIDVAGTDVLGAVDHLADNRQLGPLLVFLDGIATSDVASPAIQAHLLSPETLRRILLTEPIDAEGARQLLARCSAAHADTMLDALAISESKETRLLILQRLREIGDGARDAIVARLAGSIWQVQRNLLYLLASIPTLPDDLRIEGFAKHEEPAVRVEAVRVLVRMPARRETAIHDALGDRDPRVIRTALDAAQQGVPRRAALRLLQCLQQADKDSDVRVRGIPLLGQVPTTTARDWLLQITLRRRGLFRRWALQPASEELLVAVRVLAAHWGRDAAAATVFKLAAKSGDATIRDAARVTGAA